MPKKLSPTERATALAELTLWSLHPERDAIQRSLRFKNFTQAFALMTSVAGLAEQMNHHPEWFNVYGRLDITLTTHDCGGLSELDLRMARAIDTWAPG